MKFENVEFIKGVVAWDKLPSDGRPELAVIGRSNVGKSSLINMLVGRRKGVARTSNTPGRTREFNYFLLDEQFYLVDLPGLGYAKVSKQQRGAWSKLFKRYLHQRETLACLLHLVDSRHPLPKSIAP